MPSGRGYEAGDIPGVSPVPGDHRRRRMVDLASGCPPWVLLRSASYRSAARWRLV